MPISYPIQSSIRATARTHDEWSLQQLIRADQILAVRRTVLMSIPVNVLLGIASVLVAWNAGVVAEGAVWFAASSAVNLLRFLLVRMPLATATDPRGWTSEQQLQAHCVIALLSGVVWAFIPVLCDGYTSPQTLFYIAIQCGITAGAVTHGFAYSRIPICFITPPLLAAIGCLIYVGGFDRNCLAAAMLLYLLALIRSSHGSEVAFRENSRLKNEATAMSHSLEIANDDARKVAEEMRYRASHDALTGLLNRSGFLDEARRRIRGDASGFCLMLLDLDGFKSINDAFGHSAGDKLLVEVAIRLREELPERFTVARIGGDEFGVLFAVVDPREPEALAMRLIASIGAPFSAVERGGVGVSIGICRSSRVDIDELLVCADVALYAAKDGGRNRYHVFDDRLRARLEMRRDVERDLGKALADDELEVWYQPILGEGGLSLNSLEALLRWNHPRLGWIPPQELVAVASLAGLSEALMRFLLNDVCSMMQTLQAMGLPQVRVAVNVSPREMTQLPIDELILAKLKKHDLPPAMLEIEITEEVAMNLQAVQGKLMALSGAGVQIAIDDFGVGYSSLGVLRQLHVNRVKIDRGFVTGIAGSPEHQALVLAVLNLAQSFKFEVVAEGVETAADLYKLLDLGCPAMQGYFLGRPKPQHAMIEWIGQLHPAKAIASHRPRLPGLPLAPDAIIPAEPTLQ
ncbi:EAL domain-containing protein [Tardiphaga sp.]|uniref:putative bifunctional diguanylate cyclase/phosphodiesterase n=1 Tax=Tardiphaga sp. TaxID=1926292 RepID=UPI002631BC8C|nr:EAL domain-containing protein [Tardiphaga sp.]MDB5617526.1 diguanylate cyclase [Tardiphaga sp.]